MGYTHYWYRPQEISQAKFDAISADFQKLILALSDAGVKLGDGLGVGVPTITAAEIRFNGLAKCGHVENNTVSIPWPAKGAKGIAGDSRTADGGNWFAGRLLTARCCNGDCSYETFDFPRVIEKDHYMQPSENHPNLFFYYCKTAYRPYDVAVTAFLVIAKHHLGELIEVSSDGDDENWDDGKWLCNAYLGYGPEFEMTNDGLRFKVAA